MRLRRPRFFGWSRLAETVRRSPAKVLAISLLILVPPAAAATRAHFSHNMLQELPSDADSVTGFDVLSRHFDRGQVSPLMVVVEHDRSLWDPRAFQAINDLTVTIGKIPGVARVLSLSQPTGGAFTDEDLQEAGVGDLGKFPDRLEEGAGGVAKVIAGLREMRGGLVEMRARLPELQDGLGEGAAGVAEIRDGIRRMRAGMAEMRAGLSGAANGLDRPGSDDDLRGLAGGAAGNSLGAFQDLGDHPEAATCTAQQNTPFCRALVRIGTAYGQLTGADPLHPDEPAGNDAGTRSYFEAGGMAGSLEALAAGLREAGDGLDRIDGGLARIDGGLAQLGPGLAEGAEGVGQVVDGAGQMVGGLDRIIPGLERLRAGLAEGAARVRSAGFGDAASAGNLGLTPALIEAIPALAGRLDAFVTDDRTATRLFVMLEYEPFDERSLEVSRTIREIGPLALNNTPLEGTQIQVAGSPAFVDDIRTLSRADFPVIVMAVLLGIVLVLALLLRSVVAPVYLLLTVLLSFLSTLGLTTLVFQGILGEPGLPWWLPSFLFVMLVALGADYNIFLMSRIREEAREHTTAVATARGLALTGHVITSAGLILAGTFAALMFAPLRSLQTFGFAVTVGILLDTFVVRSLLVPSIATLLGRHNWWPSRRAHAR